MSGSSMQTGEAQVRREWLAWLAGCPVAAALIRTADGAILALNDRGKVLSGHPSGAEEIGGFLNVELGNPESQDLAGCLAAASQPFEAEASFRVGDKHPSQRVRVILLPTPGSKGKWAIGFLTSAPETQGEEQALAAARDAALESARLKSEFLANISHEIRTPLNGIIGMTQLLRDTKLGSLQRNFTDTIRLSADHLLQLINEILDFSKLEAGKLIVEHTPYDLHAAVEGALDLLAERAHSKGLELTYRIHVGVPARVLGDVGRLRQVLANLLANAIKFTEQGEVALELSAEAGDDGRPALKFEIVDTGIGIPEAALPRLFQMFQQVDSSTSRRFGGTGLGLAICRQLVEVMRGTIGVASRPEQGSRFWFRIPLETPTDKALPAPTDDSTVRLAQLRVLLLETNATNARNLEAALRDLKVACDCVTSGQDALAALREGARTDRPFGVAILDQDTPGMDGLTIARAIRLDPAINGTRILLLTTLTQHLETSQLHASLVGACLTKPLKISRLPDYLIAALSGEARHRPAPHRELRAPEPIQDHGSTHPPAPLRIMVAEDNPINQKVARGLLTRLGHTTEIVDTGRKLLRAVELAPCDIIFMDCQLPEMDGLQATRELRRREAGSGQGRRIYIIAMTADVVAGARERCIEAGMDDYLSKPIRLEELQTVLRRAGEFVKLTGNRGGARTPAGLLDPQVMETLRMLRIPGQPDPLPALFAEFIEHAENRLEEIQVAAMNQDVGTLEHAAHSLRGSAAGIGALRLSELAAELEGSIRQGSMQKTAEMLSQLEEEFRSVRRSLEFERER